MLLAIDTATRVMSLALHDGKQLLAEQTWQTNNNHTAELIPAIQHLLAQHETSTADLSALAVSVGPGSYTGLRIGVATAKGLAAAHKLPLVGVSTLDTIAAGQLFYQRYALVTVVEAGRSRIIAARYRWSKGEWVARGEASIMTWEELIANIDGPAYIAGDITEDGLAQIDAAAEADIPVKAVPAVYRLRRAGFLAEVAWARLQDESLNHDAKQLTPLYVKTDSLP